MNDLQATQSIRDDWEDWSDDDDNNNNNKNKNNNNNNNAIAPIIRHNNPFLQPASAHTPSLTQPKPPAHPTARRPKPKQPSLLSSSLSSSKLQRLKSRKRQKHQNEKLGIRLVTDMTNFRKGPHHVAQLVHPASGPASSEANINKFADPSALRALEGSPNLASVGNWAWLKDSQSPASATPDSAHCSPSGDKIVIGMAMPEQEAAHRAISPQTATIATPTDRFPTTHHQSAPRPSAAAHHHSAWSPDTEDASSPARYLQASLGGGQTRAPPVPAVPSHLKRETKASGRVNDGDNNDDDDFDFTPVTLFEEDGGRKSPASAVSKISPETTRSRSGWWDHIRTPFKERFTSPTSRSAKDATSPDEWWKGADTKPGQMTMASPQTTASDAASSSTLRPVVPIIREPSPAIASSSRSSPPPSSLDEPRSEKAGVVTEEHADPGDVPPPYEHTPSSKQDVRLRAVFPPGHYLASEFPPSPMPGSPGLGTCVVTAQSGDRKMACMMNMADVPLTPARTGAESTHSDSADVPLPDRVAGTYVGDQHQQVQGDSPAAQIEKTRRRHEKEDYVARKLGGAWKGRTCCLNGCYGRSGREGRQRRRCWLWICLAFWLVTIVAVVLGVVLSRKLAAAPASDASGSSASSSPATSSSDTPESKTSVWLNLTSFPPIPTGLSTVVGADNSEAITGCVAPETLWSCSLPPEQQAANEPSDANQPTFIFQIQYDNDTRMRWDIPNGDPPTPSTSTSSTAAASTASSSSSSASAIQSASSTSSATSSAASATTTDDLRGSDPGRRHARRDDTLYDTGIAPNPAPPSFDEMWFLGNWTDGIVSANKSGEPTPFYISFFTSLNGSAGANMLTSSSSSSSTTTSKRGGIGAGSGSSGSLADDLPAPIVNADGTGAAAQLRPFPYQQPLRLYDRGLPTEHYGFYSYFNKTIYVATMDNTSTVTSSNEGGVLETSAAWYATWTQTRFVVKIWTQKTAAANARLIGGGGGASSSSNTTSPGSFPYPITIGEDTHGGDLQLKQTFAFGVEADQVVNRTLATTFVNDMSYGGAVVNAAYPDGDLSWGGTDGGKGGCRCEWVNWVDAEGNADETFG